MTFADIIAQLENGKAAKRPSWRGFVKKVAGATEGAYDIVFVKPAAAAGQSPTTYTYHIAANGTITTSDTLTMDVELFASMCSTDWFMASTSEFEAALAGTGTW